MNEIEHERFQLVPVNEQGFPYEQATAARSGKQNEDHLSFSNSHPIECAEGDSPGADIVATAAANGQTVYVTPAHQQPSASSDDAENLQYNPASGSGPQIRFEEDSYPNRYEYQQQHQQQQSHSHSSTANNPHGNPEEIKIELIRGQHASLHVGKIHGSAGDDPHNQSDSKIHYTNLDVSPHNYYSITTEGYQPPGSSFAYLSAGPNKDYNLYQGSPNTVLYKGSRLGFGPKSMF